MIFIDEMNEMRLYKRPFHLLIDKEDKRKSCCTFLLTPDLESTIKLLLNPLLINRNYYESYYIEKAITYMINHEGFVERDLDGEYTFLNEATEHEKMKNKMRYHKSKLKNKMKDRIEKTKDGITGNNVIAHPNLSTPNIPHADISVHKEDEDIALDTDKLDNDLFIECDVDDGKVIIINNEVLDEQVFLEKANNNKYNNMLYKILYKERLKTNKSIFNIYDQVKDKVPYITKTFLSYDRYNSKNLFIDMSYYNKSFFDNNIYKLDKAVDLYCEFIYRFVNDKRLDKNGYHKKCVLVPINDWIGDINKELDYTQEINPVSMIIRLVRKNRLNLLQRFEGVDFLFLGDKGYFKMDISKLSKGNITKFITFINKLKLGSEIIDNDAQPTPSAIASDIIDKIETSQKVKINNLTGHGETIDKNELVDKINKASATSADVDNALDNLNKDNLEVNRLIQQISDEEDNNVKINAARASRLVKLQNEFLDKKVYNTSVKDMISKANEDTPLPKTSLKIDTINEEWEDLKYTNFEKIYDPNDDIVNMLYSFSKKTLPVGVVSLDVEDTSTSQDYKDTYTVKMEDALGSRFTIKFDIPQLVDNKFMMLRGNQKAISGQLTLIPILKTDGDAVQIVSNYKKMFIRRYYTSSGKSCSEVDRLIKTITKNNFKGLEIKEGDGRRVCSMYELPLDYIDLSSCYSKFITKDYIIYFNQDEIREKYKIDDKKGIPIAYDKTNNMVIYYDGVDCLKLVNSIIGMLAHSLDGFMEAFENTNMSKKYTYSRVSILSTEIPLIVMMAFSEGLTKSMDKANVRYEITEKRKYDKNSPYDYIKFKDGYIYFEDTYEGSLLMNGLKECNTEDYSLMDINKKSTYVNFLELFGGRILSDGLDNFYDLMIDPITEEVLKKYKLPTDYITLLGYANLLLVDNKYVAHTDMTGRRYRSNELIAGYTYQALAESYGRYRTGVRKKGKDTMVIKQTAVIDKIMADPTSADVSELNDLQLLEIINSVTNKGLTGMNSDRSYGLDKRAYDDTMLNILGLSTGFAGNVGLTRQATLDMNVESKRGYLKVTSSTDDLNVTKTLTATEALTPFGTTRDDPFRSAMNYIQTSKHGMRVKRGLPSLISNGADQALPYLTPNIFSFKTKAPGKVLEKTDEYMILEYNNGTKDFVDLRSNPKKNSNGGFYTDVKLDTKFKQGDKFKENEIVAYDKLSYSDVIGGPSDGIAYNLGVFTKIAILSTDEGYEDSAIISDKLADNLSSVVIVEKEIALDKNCNIYNMVKKGQPIKEGDPLLIFQNAFEDDDVNILMKNLAGDEDEISDLGRIRIKSKVTGWVHDIKIYKTVDNSELSSSLRKAVEDYERPLKKLKKVLDKNKINSNKIVTVDKLDNTGVTKDTESGVKIKFYLAYNDRMSIGDKIVYYSALKGVDKEMFPIGKEPYTKLRPNEKINALLSIGSVNGRMVCSIKNVGAINKVLVELDRAVKSKLGIPWTDIDNIQ